MKKTTLLAIWALVLTAMLAHWANAETRLFVPQFSYGPQQDTQLLLLNSNDGDSTVDLWAFTSEGRLVGQVQVTLPRNSTRSLTLSDTFQLVEPITGWLGAMSHDDIGMSYTLLGDRNKSEHGESYDALDRAAKTFQQTLEDAMRQVVRISNPNAFPAQVILSGFDQAGGFVARHDLTLPPFAQVEAGVEELLGARTARLDMRANADVVASIGQRSSPLARRTQREPAAVIQKQQFALVIESSKILGAYQVIMRFDPEVIHLSTEDVAGGIAEGFKSRPLVVNINNTTGEITLASFQVGSSPTGRMTVARINISTKAAVAPQFLLHIDEVTDSTGTSLSATDVVVGLVRLK